MEKRRRLWPSFLIVFQTPRRGLVLWPHDWIASGKNRTGLSIMSAVSASTGAFTVVLRPVKATNSADWRLVTAVASMSNEPTVIDGWVFHRDRENLNP